MLRQLKVIVNKVEHQYSNDCVWFNDVSLTLTENMMDPQCTLYSTLSNLMDYTDKVQI